MLLWEADLAVDSTTFLAGSIQNQRPIHSTQLCSLSLSPALDEHRSLHPNAFY